MGFFSGFLPGGRGRPASAGGGPHLGTSVHVQARGQSVNGPCFWDRSQVRAGPGPGHGEEPRHDPFQQRAPSVWQLLGTSALRAAEGVGGAIRPPPRGPCPPAGPHVCVAGPSWATRKCASLLVSLTRHPGWEAEAGGRLGPGSRAARRAAVPPARSETLGPLHPLHVLLTYNANERAVAGVRGSDTKRGAQRPGRAPAMSTAQLQCGPDSSA